MNEKALVGDHGMAQHAMNRFFKTPLSGIQRLEMRGPANAFALHPGRLSEQKRHRNIDSIITQKAIGQDQLLVLGGITHHRIRAALPRTESVEVHQAFRINGQNVTLLRFIRPNLHRGHSRLVDEDFTQFKASAAPRIMNDFRDCIGQSPGPHVVDGENRCCLTQCVAAIDDFLAPPLHFRVFALNRGEIQILGTFTRSDR